MHVNYLSGFEIGFRTDKNRCSTFLIVTQDEASHLVIGQSEAANAKRVFDDDVIAFEDYRLADFMVTYPRYVREKLVQILDELKKNGAVKLSRVGIEDWYLTEAYRDAILRVNSSAKLVGLSDLLLSMRKTKGHDEVGHIKQAAERLDFAYGIAKSLSKPGSEEMAYYREINSQFFEKYGPLAVAWGAYLSGERALDPLGPINPTNRQMRSGDTVILDLQTNTNGYWADTARVFIIGNVTERQNRVFNALLQTKREVEEILKPGTKASQIYTSTSNAIRQAGYGQALIHHAGHGIGLEDQEAPFFLPNSKDVIEEGDVVAVEPGIYDPSAGGGMRIEDNYLITKNGFEVLSKYPLRL